MLDADSGVKPGPAAVGARTVMGPWRLVLLLVPVLAGAACDEATRANPLYCDSTTPCTDPALPVCDATAHQCGPGAAMDLSPMCRASSDCAETAPLCVDGACRACAGAADDAKCAARGAASPRCGGDGRCHACRADTAATDCTAKATPVCDATGFACRACRAHAECTTGACLGDGSCAPAGQVAFVDNRASKPADCKAAHPAATGTSTDPFCDVADAIAVAGVKPYVVVAGSAQPYGPVTIVDRTVSLLGPGLTATPHAVVAANGASDAITIQAATASTVTIDGLEATAATSMKGGVVCLPTGTATVTLRHAYVHDNNGAGVQAFKCTLTVDASTISSNQGGGIATTNGTVTVDASTISSNQGGGISVTGGTYQITNSIIAGNGTAGPGVRLDGSSAGVFAFNTVARNLVVAGVGGVDCGGGSMKPLVDSIVATNSADSGTQLFGKCMLSHVVTGADSAAGASTQDPAFVSLVAGDFHLLPDDPKNGACCIDKVAAPGTPDADHDVDGTARPRGASWDIGAHEAK